MGMSYFVGKYKKVSSFGKARRKINTLALKSKISLALKISISKVITINLFQIKITSDSNLSPKF